MRDCLQSFGPPPQFPKRQGAEQIAPSLLNMSLNLGTFALSLLTETHSIHSTGQRGDDGATDPPEKWMVDHANGGMCRLAHGWRAVLAYRVCHSPRLLVHSKS